MLKTEKQLDHSDFEDLVGETFVFSLEGVEQEAEGVLIKAEPIKSSSPPPDSFREPFSLDFRFPPDANLGQCTFQARTAKRESLPPMFLVPLKDDEKGWIMVATFN